MYEAVRARPAGPSTVARLAATAADYGYAGIVVANPPAARATYDPSAIRDRYGVDVVDGVELVPAGPAEAAGAVGNARPSSTLLCLRGGRPGMNRFAVRQDRVDVLTRPLAADGDVDHVQVRAAADNGVRVSVELDPVLRSTGDERTAAIAGLRKLRHLLEAYDAPYVVTAGAGSHLELRAPRDLAAAAAVAGFDRAAVEHGLAEWGRLAERNRERLSDAFVAPGVRIDGDETAGGTDG